MKRDIRDSLLLTLFSFILAIVFESMFRSGNTWVANMVLLWGRSRFASLFVTLFFLGYMGLDYIVLHYLNEPFQRRGAYAGLLLIQAFILVILMPH